MDNIQKIQELLATESDQLSKLNSIVVNAIEEEKLLSQKLYEAEERSIDFGSRVADAVASFGGSWKFIITFIMLMLIWIVGNFVLNTPFDPYPFILLNLFLSAVAAVQAPIIMMSQNRKEDKDRQRATNDYLVNLKAEIEVRNLHQKIDLLMSEQMQTLFEIQKVQMELMEEIRNVVKK
jgi:uncharacterized membrane protein